MDIETARIRAFATPADFGEWLARCHAQEQEVWLRIYKKSSLIPSVTWAEAIQEALAWGWIDGIKKANNDASWFQRFTPRKPRSKWSRINQDHVERLMADGRMREPGLREVAAAKADGRWDSAYAGSAKMEFPDAFLRAVNANATAAATFATLSRGRLYAGYHRLQTVKKDATRQKLMTEFIEMLSRGAWPF
jgi:uncharacterized protein YdeI (YjbR/CyaY-like superfamily)